MEALAKAEAAARRGLALKADCPQLWLAWTRVERGRAEWDAAQGRPPDPGAIHAGLRDVDRALRLRPAYLEALAEKAALEMTRTARSPASQAALAPALDRNPFLKRAYFDVP